ncbi:uncharacterized protein ACLA_005670 [Aspergillus clavatus NRRL 1]|uniref:DUF7707 domain-containing protein n=1 Tax=Aspergillus clavatus (strain ATCC 1007 / CBS 513.65 / DSM 816 / NCTC 3887 / NRRL 1 / QM 1276 / 107) TaxID=344612 RepID=A1CD84_ASPCL|nr:uncharacterized protein ACLA_005670 [Aspergillus clavatus NRRL 1]EAW11811.1 conserved hypothetical protein [Aspergillus clavatus NRRL 1]
MRSFAVVLSTLVAATAATSSYTLPAGFNIGQILPAERNSWCLAERNACPKICGGTTNSNSCDPQTLDFACVCSNGTTANVEPYTQTIPFFVCQATFAQCIAAAATLDDDEKCKDAQKKCGTEDPFSSDSSSTTTTSSSSVPTATETESSTGKQVETSATASSTTSSTASAQTSNAAIRVGQEHSTGLMATVFFFAARLLL